MGVPLFGETTIYIYNVERLPLKVMPEAARRQERVLQVDRTEQVEVVRQAGERLFRV